MSANNVKYVNSNAYAEKVLDTNFNLNFSSTQIPDKIRYFSKNFWTSSQNKIVKAKDLDKNKAFFNLIYEGNGNYLLVADKTKFSSEIIENGLLVKKFDKNSWYKFLNKIIPGFSNTSSTNPAEVYEDFYFEINEPINIPQNDKNFSVASNFLNKEFVYNFYNEQHEFLTNNIFFDVATLPDIFSILNDRKLNVRTEEENLKLSLGGLIPNALVDSLFLSNRNNETLQDYFSDYAKKYNSEEALLVKKQLKNKNTEIILNETKINLINNFVKNYVPFPFYCSLRFSNPSLNKDNFINRLRSVAKAEEELLQYISSNINDRPTNFINDSGQLNEISMPSLDFKDWIAEGLGVENNNFVFSRSTLGTDGVSSAAANEAAANAGIVIPPQQISSQDAIKFINVYKLTKQILKEKARKPENIFDLPCHSEVLFFKIEKRLFDNNSTPIQTFLFPANSNEIINFIDTQIKYGTEYYYSIKAFVLLVGSKYSYTPFNYNSGLLLDNDLANGYYRVKVESKPDYRIVEVPYCKFSGAIYEKPFCRPQIKIEQNNNQALINILFPIKESLEEIEPIEINDFDSLKKVSIAQDNEEADKIFCLTDFSGHKDVEIFRSDVRPKNYLSFQGKLLKTLRLEQNSNSFTENIVKNVKYYYTFRFLNKHNLPSNPSVVYEVEMVTENDFSQLLIKEINLKEPPKRTNSKDLKRYLLVRPSIIQTQPRFGPIVNSVDDVQLGSKISDVWNKNIIIRIKSKKTNRIIEINLLNTINKKK